jgi:hypothetical protein
MKKNNKEFRITWQQGVWVITDPSSPHSQEIQVDSAVVTATRRAAGWVEGFIVAVHGLDLEVAARLDRQTLSSLGVGSHLRANAGPPTRRTPGRVYLMPDGQMQGARDAG